MHPLIQLKRATSLFLIVLGFVWLGLLPKAQAVSPAPDGGYPGGNTAEGQAALLSLTTGGYNTAVGFLSLRSNTTNSFNTAVGAGALFANTANENTAVGAEALLLNTTGTRNTANGAFALVNNTGNDNTAIGDRALQQNTTGNANAASGSAALYSNTTGGANTAIGGAALYSNSTASFNTATGNGALFSNTTGGENTATGVGALLSNIDGGGNVAIGQSALNGNAHGDYNTVIGWRAGLNVEGTDDIYIGATTAAGVTSESTTIRIGDPGFLNACFVAGIFGQPVDPSTGVTALVDTNGKLGTMVSSRRFKHDIKPMDKASEDILALKPVTFHYKSDAKNTPCFGLIAEEVAGINPNLIVRDKNGEVLSVRYDQVNAMLLNEFLKEHRKVQELEATVAEQHKGMEVLAAQLKEQAAQIQKVSAQLEMSKPAPKTVLNNQ